MRTGIWIRHYWAEVVSGITQSIRPSYLLFYINDTVQFIVHEVLGQIHFCFQTMRRFSYFIITRISAFNSQLMLTNPCEAFARIDVSQGHQMVPFDMLDGFLDVRC